MGKEEYQLNERDPRTDMGRYVTMWATMATQENQPEVIDCNKEGGDDDGFSYFLDQEE